MNSETITELGVVTESGVVWNRNGNPHQQPLGTRIVAIPPIACDDRLPTLSDTNYTNLVVWIWERSGVEMIGHYGPCPVDATHWRPLT